MRLALRVAWVGVPWFRAHVSLLNDPGRLLSAHLMHTALVAGWPGIMLLYELLTLDPTDPAVNPLWRQGSYVIAFVSRLGVLRSEEAWALAIIRYSQPSWTYELVLGSHLSLAGLALSAGAWHWAYWDLNVFASSTLGTRALVFDLHRVLGIHLLPASALCFGLGLAHLTGSFGPGLWTSDSFGLVGSLRFLKPSYSVIALGAASYGVLSSHHIAAGAAGLSAALWHLAASPGRMLGKLLRMATPESLLASAVAAVAFASSLAAALSWYGSVILGIELDGPTRYHWDNASFSQELARRVKTSAALRSLNRAWEEVPDKLLLYDYLGSNPAKGGLFRAGPMLKGDGLLQNWLGHASFSLKTLSLSVRRMPAFFERFPLLLIDRSGTVRADIAFRRAESRYSIEERKVRLAFAGGVLNGRDLASPSLVKDYARKAQFGEIFRVSALSARFQDGVFRTSPRGWYSFSHVVFAGLFGFGHLWHASRALWSEIWHGLSMESLRQVEYGRNEALGDEPAA